MAKRRQKSQDARSAKKARALENIDISLGSNSWDQLASEEELEVENTPRRFQNDDDDEIERLPVITQRGTVKRVIEKNIKRNAEKFESSSEEESEIFEETNPEDESASETETEENLPADLIALKEIIASHAESLNEDPEENIGKLRELRNLLTSKKHYKLQRLVLLSLVSIFKNLIPGYKVRPLSDAEKKEKVSKDVRKLRDFEETLIANYHAYVNSLAELAKAGRNTPKDSGAYILAKTSITCACELLSAVPYFNFRNDLVTILIRRLQYANNDDSFAKCISAIEFVFQNDYEGHVSFDVVRILAKMVKSRRYKVEPEILNALLHLRLLTELEGQADLERVQLTRDEEARANAKSLKKKNRVHLTKKERKQRREQKEIEKEHMKAETAVSVEERERIQGETLKLVFILYFNILKERSKALMGVALEGLAKFAHLVNADFFGDLLEILRELVNERQNATDSEGHVVLSQNATRETLLCVMTAFVLLQGQYKNSQLETMNVDLAFFINHFYSMLYALALNADIELSIKTLRVDDPLLDEMQKKPKVNVATLMEMAVRSFDAVFFHQKSANKSRVQGFAKRLSIMSLHVPETSCLASLKVLDRLNQRYSSTLSGLYSSEDRVANGVFHFEANEPEHANSEAATIWETTLLEKHYSKRVAKLARELARRVSI